MIIRLHFRHRSIKMSRGVAQGSATRDAAEACGSEQIEGEARNLLDTTPGRSGSERFEQVKVAWRVA